jgi:hypothetical protein
LEAFARCGLGVVALAVDPDQAEELWGESLQLARGLGDTWLITFVLVCLGMPLLLRGAIEEAAERWQESTRLAVQTGNRRSLAASLEGLAEIAGLRGEPERAAHWMGAAAALRASLHAPALRFWSARVERCQEVLRGTLGEAGFSAAHTAGGSAPLEEVIESVLTGSEGWSARDTPGVP